MKIEELNKAKTIKLSNEICSILIDKVNHKIIQTKQWNQEMYEDITSICENMEKNYTKKGTNKGGIIVSKLLNNRPDICCKSFIKEFQVILS